MQSQLENQHKKSDIKKLFDEYGINILLFFAFLIILTSIICGILLGTHVIGGNKTPSTDSSNVALNETNEDMYVYGDNAGNIRNGRYDSVDYGESGNIIDEPSGGQQNKAIKLSSMAPKGFVR